MQHTRVGFTDEEVKKLLRDTTNDWNSYKSSGKYEQAWFELDDKDIVKAAKHLWESLVNAHIIAMKSLAGKELEQIQEEISDIQKLINQRLQEL